MKDLGGCAKPCRACNRKSLLDLSVFILLYGVRHRPKMLDILSFIGEKGGNPEGIRESQRRRYAPVEVVDEVIASYDEWRRGIHPSPLTSISC